MTELSKDYAEALYALAAECGQEKPYLEALESVDALFADHPDYIELLAAPSIPQSERANLIEQAFGDTLPEQVLSFVQLLTAHGRIRSLTACVEDYRRLYQAAVAMSTAYVTSAVALTEEQKSALADKLTAKFGRRVELVCEVDESLLGGITVRLDGVVLDGHSTLDTVALTGESVPREVEPGNPVMSGCINTSGVLTVRVEKEYEESTVAKILDLVENASSKKAEAENFITRFARYYTPIVVVIAAMLAVVPPMVLGEPFSGWIYRALVFLVISCPCALVISIPLTFFSGLGVCSRHGILVKGSNYLEALAQLETAVFDKTGTLTKGQFAVTAIHPAGISEEQLLYYTACAESISNHPIAEAVQKANKQAFSANALQEAEEIAGHGIAAVVDGHRVLAGNHRLMEREHVVCEMVEETGTSIYIAVDGTFCGWIVIADELKPDAPDMVTRLKQLGVKDLVMLTGDNPHTAQQVANQLGITQVFSQLLPGDKVDCLEQLLQQKNPNRTVAFTGDGLNDAPVLARADIGIAMGGLGSDAAIEAADVVIMDDQPGKLADAVQIARKTRSIVKQNIIFVLAVKLLVLLLGALGMATMWMAVFADVGVAFLAILNAVRILKY